MLGWQMNGLAFTLLSLMHYWTAGSIHDRRPSYCAQIRHGSDFGLVQVDQSTVAIKENFGKFSEVLEPGCHFLPWCIGQQIAGYLSLRVRQLDIRCETKTKVFSVAFHFDV